MSQQWEKNWTTELRQNRTELNSRQRIRQQNQNWTQLSLFANNSKSNRTTHYIGQT